MFALCSSLSLRKEVAMSKPTTYDFSETAAFLDESVQLGDLYEMACDGMRILSAPKRYLTREKRRELWHILLTCADFIDTINLK